MTAQEIQQVNAIRAFYEAQIANLSHEGANKALQCESLAITLKTTQDELAALKQAPNKKAKD